MENISENNSVELAGEISIAPKLNHESYEEKFYKFFIKIKRFSELFDEIPIIVSERLIDVNTLKIGEIAHVKGQCRSFNQIEDGKSRLILSIFAKEIEKTEDRSLISLNLVTFIGYICKKPICRKTPLGRDIADVLIAVNRTYKKSDYIPTILWGRNAKFCETLEVGAQVKLSGRIQSRAYEKKLDDETIIPKVAYELSASKLAIYKASTDEKNSKKEDDLKNDKRIDEELTD